MSIPIHSCSFEPVGRDKVGDIRYDSSSDYPLGTVTISKYHANQSTIFREYALFSKADVMIFIAAYFDESGIHLDSTVIVVAGILATTKQWVRFDRQWRKILAKENIKIFHMTDFLSSQGEFKGWIKDRKGPFIDKLTDAIRMHSRFYFVHAVRRSEFDAVKVGYPTVNISAYQLCCEQCMTGISHWARKSAKPVSVAVYFEQGNKIMSETIKLFQKVPDSEFLRNKYRINQMTFARKDEQVGLQAADMLAHGIYTYHRKLLEGSDNPVPQSLQALFKERKYMLGDMNNPATIRNWFGRIL